MYKHIYAHILIYIYINSDASDAFESFIPSEASASFP